MVTCAKQLSSGYLPISALMISDKVYDVLKEQSKKHGAGDGLHLWRASVSCAVALETLKIYEERKIVDHVQKIAPHFQVAWPLLAIAQ